MSTFGQINVPVSDMAASIEFYRLLELKVPDSFEWPAGSRAEHVDDMHSDDGCYMAFDNHPMARIWNPAFDPDRREGNVVIGLLVETRDDVDRLFEKVKAAGHPVGQEPYDAFFGSRYAIVIEPDGNQVGLKSPSKTTANTHQTSRAEGSFGTNERIGAVMRSLSALFGGAYV